MGRDSYPTPLYAVDSDIKKVGGDDAYIGMTREGPDGKQYMLVQSFDVNGSYTTGKLIIGWKGGQIGKASLVTAPGRCLGVTIATSVTISNDQYFWIQTDGRADGVVSTGATKGTYLYPISAGIGSSMNGVGGNPAVLSTITEGHAGTSADDFTVTNYGVVGWCISDTDANNQVSVIVKPELVWGGTVGGPLSDVYPEDT